MDESPPNRNSLTDYFAVIPSEVEESRCEIQSIAAGFLVSAALRSE
jgi:hypothetical protein